MSLKVKYELVIRSIAGECVAIPVGKAASKVKGLLSLTPSGELLLRKLQQGCEYEELVECLLEEYEVEREAAEKDVTIFVEKLRAIDLL